MFRDIIVPDDSFENFRKSLLSGAHNDSARLVEVESEKGEDEDFFDFPEDWEPLYEEPAYESNINFDAMSSSMIVSFQYSPSDEEALMNGAARPDTPLFEGSSFVVKDICRSLLHIKSTNAGIGDRLSAVLVGVLATFLPRHNALTSSLGRHPTMYKTLKFLHNMADVGVRLRCYQVGCCTRGCVAYWNTLQNANVCPKCKVSDSKV